MITAIFYALVFVLAFPSLADAECAWVLWHDGNPVRGYPTYEACLKDVPNPAAFGSHLGV